MKVTVLGLITSVAPMMADQICIVSPKATTVVSFTLRGLRCFGGKNVGYESVKAHDTKC